MEQEPIQRNGLAYRVATRTDIGLRRERNEDFMGVDTTDHGLLMVVCDGMGGHRGGGQASRRAVETFLQSVKQGEGNARDLLTAAAAHSSRTIYRESQESPELWGMGTTLVAALVRENRVTLLNIGDSRAYHFRNGTLSRLTIDHSHVGELMARGELTEEQARTHPQRNLITRALGVEELVAGDLYETTLAPGDKLLLSTDGLHGVMPDSMIAAILGRTPTPERTCDALIEEALARGGDDNITVALLAVDDNVGEQGPMTAPITLPPGNGGGSFPSRLLYPLFGLLLLLSLWAVWYYSVGDNGTTGVVDSTRGGASTLPINDSATFDSTAPQLTPGDLVADSGVVDSLSESRLQEGHDSGTRRGNGLRGTPTGGRRR